MRRRIILVQRNRIFGPRVGPFEVSIALVKPGYLDIFLFARRRARRRRRVLLSPSPSRRFNLRRVRRGVIRIRGIRISRL
jgi:hypothetical protein